MYSFEDKNYFHVIKQGTPKKEVTIVTLECFSCGCIAEANAEGIKKDDERDSEGSLMRRTYYHACPCCGHTMYDIRTREIKV